MGGPLLKINVYVNSVAALFFLAWTELNQIRYNFYKNNFIRTRGSFLKKKIRNNPAMAEEQSRKFSFQNQISAVIK